MEVLFFIIFGGLLLLFIGYGIKLHREDKKILKQLEDQEEKKRQSESHDDLPDWDDEASVMNSERPFIDSYLTLN